MSQDSLHDTLGTLSERIHIHRFPQCLTRRIPWLWSWLWTSLVAMLMHTSTILSLLSSDSDASLTTSQSALCLAPELISDPRLHGLLSVDAGTTLNCIPLLHLKLNMRLVDPTLLYSVRTPDCFKFSVRPNQFLIEIIWVEFFHCMCWHSSHMETTPNVETWRNEVSVLSSLSMYWWKFLILSLINYDELEFFLYLFSKCCLELSHKLSRDVRVLLKVLEYQSVSFICIALGVVFVQQLMCDIEDQTSLANTFSTLSEWLF